jgi:hypothetical protein
MESCCRRRPANLSKGGGGDEGEGRPRLREGMKRGRRGARSPCCAAGASGEGSPAPAHAAAERRVTNNRLVCLPEVSPEPLEELNREGQGCRAKGKNGQRVSEGK